MNGNTNERQSVMSVHLAAWLKVINLDGQQVCKILEESSLFFQARI